MRVLWLCLLYRLALLAALTASVVLVIDYGSGTPTFCGGEGTGCAAVRASELARWIQGTLDVNFPTIGTLAFALLFGTSLLVSSKVHVQALAVLTGVGALGAVGLLGEQAFVIHAFCKYCVVIDLSTIVAAVTAGLLAREAARDSAGVVAQLAPEVRRLALWASIAGMAMALPYVWARHPVEPPAPAEIAALGVKDQVTVVSFTDFECPYCRSLHPIIDGLGASYPGRVTVLRKMVPLAFHPGALPAAKAFLCVPADKQPAMADKLYEAEPEQLTPEGTAAIATQLGVDAAAFGACVASPATQAAIDADRALYKGLGGQGLPSTYVGGTFILGAVPEGILDAVQRHLDPGFYALPVPLLFVTLFALFAVAAALDVRSRVRAPGLDARTS